MKTLTVTAQHATAGVKKTSKTCIPVAIAATSDVYADDPLRYVRKYTVYGPKSFEMEEA